MLKHKKFLTAMMIFIVATLVATGCSENDQLLNSKANVNEPVKAKSNVEVVYTGNESLQEMLTNYFLMVDSGVVQPLDDAGKQEMIDAFLLEQKRHAVQISAASQTVIAYTAHYVYGSDKDLWLEYKWWAGSQQGYHFETPIWSLYWAIRVCYGGNILNWTWMEGGYQRVTGVVGSCVYVPFGSGFVRYYLRIVTH